MINDRGREVSNLFRILQRHYPQFLDVLRFQLTVRAEFDRLVATDPETLTDLERAARFLYLQRTAFGGKRVESSGGVLHQNVRAIDRLRDKHTARAAGQRLLNKAMSVGLLAL